MAQDHGKVDDAKRAALKIELGDAIARLHQDAFDALDYYIKPRAVRNVLKTEFGDTIDRTGCIAARAGRPGS